MDVQPTLVHVCYATVRETLRLRLRETISPGPGRGYDLDQFCEFVVSTLHNHSQAKRVGIGKPFQLADVEGTYGASPVEPDILVELLR